MEYMMIAVIGNNEGFRILNLQTHKMIDASAESVYDAITFHKANILNLRAEQTKPGEHKLTGTNGALSRYTHLNRITHRADKRPVIIIDQIEGYGYTVTDYTGTISNWSASMVISIGQEHGIANGKLAPTENGLSLIEPIGHDFNTITWVERANIKLALLGLNDYKIRINGDIAVINQEIQKCIIPSGIKIIGDYIFAGCVDLSQISISDTVQQIGVAAFEKCISITEINIPENVEIISKYAFWKCSGMKNVTLHEGLREIGEHAFEECKGLTSIEIPNTVTRLDEGVFRFCINLCNVIIGKGIKRINAYTFGYCNKINSIFIPKNVEAIDKLAFASCNGLKQIVLESGKTRVPTELVGCHNIEYKILDK